jgi:hypothetical protein
VLQVVRKATLPVNGVFTFVFLVDTPMSMVIRVDRSVVQPMWHKAYSGKGECMRET